MLTEKNLKDLRQKLDSTLVDIKTELGELEDEKGEAKPVDFGSDVESTDDAPEETDEAEEISTNAAIANGLKERLENVENALRKMSSKGGLSSEGQNKNEFGKCDHCHEDISLEVLTVAPESRLCKNCKK